MSYAYLLERGEKQYYCDAEMFAFVNRNLNEEGLVAVILREFDVSTNGPVVFRIENRTKARMALLFYGRQKEKAPMTSIQFTPSIVEHLEREEFKKQFAHLDLTEDRDAWGRPKFMHSHVDAMWSGWHARFQRKSIESPVSHDVGPQDVRKADANAAGGASTSSEKESNP